MCVMHNSKMKLIWELLEHLCFTYKTTSVLCSFSSYLFEYVHVHDQRNGFLLSLTSFRGEGQYDLLMTFYCKCNSVVASKKVGSRCVALSLHLVYMYMKDK